MSLKKKVVWLPYDMDTAIGINNEGELLVQPDDGGPVRVIGSGEVSVRGVKGYV